MFKDINEYKKFKFMEDIIFNGLNERNSNWLYNYDMFEFFINTVTYFHNNNYIGFNEFKNINDVLNKSLIIVDENKPKRESKTCWIFGKLMRNNNVSNFYKDESKKRKIKFKKSEDFYNNIRESIHNDLLVINVCYDLDGIDFFNFTDLLINNNHFYESINAVLNEYPEVFNNKVFYSRIMFFLTNIKENNIDNKNNKIYNKLKRKFISKN